MGSLRMWDTNTGNMIVKKEFTDPIGGLEISNDGEIITVAVGRKVVFLDGKTLETEKEVSVPCSVYSASLHHNKDIFVCGGEDLKLYKFDYNTGIEIETSRVTLVPFTVCGSVLMVSCTPQDQRALLDSGRLKWVR